MHYILLALAFCDYSDIQKFRRNVIQAATFPHSRGQAWHRMNRFSIEECYEIQKAIGLAINLSSDFVNVDVRPIILKVSQMTSQDMLLRITPRHARALFILFFLPRSISICSNQACGNIFNRYFCECPRYEYDDAEFTEYVNNFDHVFWEVNQSRVCDVLPNLYFTAWWPVHRARQAAKQVRKFVDGRILEQRHGHE